jgi:hypothetical protein
MSHTLYVSYKETHVLLAKRKFVLITKSDVMKKITCFVFQTLQIVYKRWKRFCILLNDIYHHIISE